MLEHSQSTSIRTKSTSVHVTLIRAETALARLVPFKHPRPNPPTSFESFPPSRARVAHAHVLYQDFPLRNIIITLPRPPPMLIRARARRFRARLRAFHRARHLCCRTTNRDPSRSPSTGAPPRRGARARAIARRARATPRPSPRALWRCRAPPEPRRASDEFHRTPRGASHTAGDVARTGATRERARIPTPMAPMARDAARGDRMR